MKSKQLKERCKYHAIDEYCSNCVNRHDIGTGKPCGCPDCSPTPAKKEDNSSPMNTSHLNSSKSSKSEPVGEEVGGLEERLDEKFPFGSFAGSSIRIGEIKAFIVNELYRQRKSLVEMIEKLEPTPEEYADDTHYRQGFEKAIDVILGKLKE